MSSRCRRWKSLIDGIINVYKESGYTSHDVVAKLRGILKQKKIGHTGTLDPEAQGVLPVCLGRATKVCDLLTDKTKEYRAVLKLGVVTDTQDMTGSILSESDVTCTEEQVRACIMGFVGGQEQIPPMYSALKVNGKKLCDLARQGVEVERRPRRIVIGRITIEKLELPEVTISVVCSKGTYIRTLCHDIGAALGCGGCMKSLLRTRVGSFTVEESVTLAEIERCRNEGRLSEIVCGTDSVFMGLPKAVLSDQAERLVRNGNPVTKKLMEKCIEAETGIKMQEASDAAKEPDGQEGAAAQLRLYSAGGDFLAIYEWNEEKDSYRAVKMFL